MCYTLLSPLKLHAQAALISLGTHVIRDSFSLTASYNLKECIYGANLTILLTPLCHCYRDNLAVFSALYKDSDRKFPIVSYRIEAICR